MSILFPDTVTITPITRDVSYRTETEGTPFSSKAFVEDESITVRDASGAQVKPDSNIFLPKNTSISKGDYITITELHGVTVSIKIKVKQAFKVGTRTNSHIEVLYSGSK